MDITASCLDIEGARYLSAFHAIRCPRLKAAVSCLSYSASSIRGILTWWNTRAIGRSGRANGSWWLSSESLGNSLLGSNEMRLRLSSGADTAGWPFGALRRDTIPLPRRSL